MEFAISPDVLLGLVVAALALFFDYFPGVSKKFDEASIETKRLLTVGLAVLAAVVVFAGQCYGYFATNLTCTVKDGWDLLYGIVISVAVMYGFHKATKPSK